jgi:hypothetical protein
MNQLAAHGRGRQFLQRITLVSFRWVDRNLFELVHGHGRRLAQAFYDDLAADALFDKLLDLLENLAGNDDNGRGPIANFGVLRSSNVGEDSGRGVDDVQELSS